jgi:hypothetical protein
MSRDSGRTQSIREGMSVGFDRVDESGDERRDDKHELGYNIFSRSDPLTFIPFDCFTCCISWHQHIYATVYMI